MLSAYASSKDSDQLAHLHSLLWPFAVCIQHIWALRNPYSKNKVYLELQINRFAVCKYVKYYFYVMRIILGCHVIEDEISLSACDLSRDPLFSILFYSIP